MKTLNDVGFCDFCQKININTYPIYRLGLRTNLGEFTIGILNINDEFSDFLMKKNYYISATQALLLRPDIVIDYLKQKYNTDTEHVLEHNLIEAQICKTCFKHYKEEVPER